MIIAASTSTAATTGPTITPRDTVDSSESTFPLSGAGSETKGHILPNYQGKRLKLDLSKNFIIINYI